MGGTTRRIRIAFPHAISGFLFLCLVSTGCFTARGVGEPPDDPVRAPASDNVIRPATEGLPQILAIPDLFPPAPDNAAPAPDNAAGMDVPPPAAEMPPTAGAAPSPAIPPSTAVPSVEAPTAGPEPVKRKTASPATSSDRKSRSPAAPAQEGKHASVAPVHASPGSVAVVSPEAKPPSWTQQKERLAFRVDFLGITMGYARFQYAGRVSIGGKTAYRINVRAWTSGVLAFLYPINETIEYYLDTETIQPIRIEYTGRKNKRDDAAIYDQETGKILYRYLDNGEIRKTVETVPSVYDPVSVIYYYRWRDMGREDRLVNLYGGRKVYQVAARVAGNARLTTEAGAVDTLVVEPLIRREGKVENKGDLRMWVTNDERRTPVRIYGKFRKIREWTLIGELLPERPGG